MCFTEILFTKSAKRSIKKSRRVIRLLKIPAPRPRSARSRSRGGAEPSSGRRDRANRESLRVTASTVSACAPASYRPYRLCRPENCRPAARIVRRRPANRSVAVTGSRPPRCRHRPADQCYAKLITSWSASTKTRSGCNTRFQLGLAACSRSSAMTVVVHLRLWRRHGAHIVDRSSVTDNDARTARHSRSGTRRMSGTVAAVQLDRFFLSCAACHSTEPRAQLGSAGWHGSFLTPSCSACWR